MLRRLLLAGLTTLCATLLFAAVAHAQEPCDPSTDPLCGPCGPEPCNPYIAVNYSWYSLLDYSDELLVARHDDWFEQGSPKLDLIEVGEDDRYEVDSRIDADVLSAELQDGFLYAIQWDTERVAVYDVRFVSAPQKVGELPFAVAHHSNLAVGSGALYAVTQRTVSTDTVAYDLVAVDIQDPTHPTVAAQLLDIGVRWLRIEDGLLLGATEWGLNVFDIGDPLHPSLLSSLAWASDPIRQAWSIAYRDKHAYVAGRYKVPLGIRRSCRIVDLTDAAHPVDAASCGEDSWEIAIVGDYAYLPEDELTGSSHPNTRIFGLENPIVLRDAGSVQQHVEAGVTTGDGWYLPDPGPEVPYIGEHLGRFKQNPDGSLTRMDSSRVPTGTNTSHLLEFQDGIAVFRAADQESLTLTDLRWPSGPQDIATIADDAPRAWIRDGVLYAFAPGEMRRYGIDEPSSPVQRPVYQVPAELGPVPKVVFGDDGLTYLVGESRVAIVDGRGYVAHELGQLTLPHDVITPVWAASRLYLFCADTLLIVDVASTTGPSLSATLAYGPDLPLTQPQPEGASAGNQAIYLVVGHQGVTLDIREPLTPTVTLGLPGDAEDASTTYISGAGDGWLYVTDTWSYSDDGDPWTPVYDPFTVRHRAYDVGDPLHPISYAVYDHRGDERMHADGRHLLLFSEPYGSASGWWLIQVAPESHSQMQFVAAAGADFGPQVGMTYTVPSGAVHSASAAAPGEDNACIEQYTESETARLLTAPASHLTPLTAARVIDCSDGAPLEMSEPLLLTIDLAQVGPAFLKRETAHVAQWDGSAWVTPAQWLEEGALLHVQLNDLAPWALFGEVGSGIYLPAIVR